MSQPPPMPLLEYSSKDNHGILDWFSFDRFMLRRACRGLAIVTLIWGGLESLVLVITSLFSEPPILYITAALVEAFAYALTAGIITLIGRKVWGIGPVSPWFALVLGIIGLLGDLVLIIAIPFSPYVVPGISTVWSTLLAILVVMLFAYWETQVVCYAFRVITQKGMRGASGPDRLVNEWRREFHRAGGPFSPPPGDVPAILFWHSAYWCSLLSLILDIPAFLFAIVGLFYASAIVPKPTNPYPEPFFEIASGYQSDLYFPDLGLPAPERQILLDYCQQTLGIAAANRETADELFRRSGRVLIGKKTVIKGKEEQLLSSPPTGTHPQGGTTYRFIGGELYLGPYEPYLLIKQSNYYFFFAKGIVGPRDSAGARPFAETQRLIENIRRNIDPPPDDVICGVMLRESAIKSHLRSSPRPNEPVPPIQIVLARDRSSGWNLQVDGQSFWVLDDGRYVATANRSATERWLGQEKSLAAIRIRYQWEVPILFPISLLLQSLITAIVALIFITNAKKGYPANIRRTFTLLSAALLFNAFLLIGGILTIAHAASWRTPFVPIALFFLCIPLITLPWILLSLISSSHPRRAT